MSGTTWFFLTAMALIAVSGIVTIVLLVREMWLKRRRKHGGQDNG